MIVTFTLNPAIDRTLFIPKFTAGGVNRVVSTHSDAGGHGINVCRALKVMGTEAIACGFIGGQNGRMIKDFLTSSAISYDFVEVPGETRINIKIVEEDGQHTDINEAGFEINDNDFARLSERMGQYISHENIIALCGAPTPNFEADKYGYMCRRVTARGARLIVDTLPEYLLESLKSKPVFIKPDLYELSQVLGSEIKTPQEISEGARELMARGAQNVAVGMGGRGAIFVSAQGTLYIEAPEVPVVGPVGAGAVLVAGICHALQNGMDFESLAKYSVAAASASVTVAGTGMAPRREVLRLFSRVNAHWMQ